MRLFIVHVDDCVTAEKCHKMDEVITAVAAPIIGDWRVQIRIVVLSVPGIASRLPHCA